MLTRAEAAAQVCEHIINHNAHGYSQPNRAGDGTNETITLSSGEKATIHGGDYDCSELMRQCYAAVGVLPASYWASYMWTGNEHEMLTSHGFKQVTVAEASKMKRGDVLWRSGHTEMYLGNSKQGGARGSETGGINGRTGDQTGFEIASSAYTPSRWTRAYRYVGPEKNEQVPGDAVNNMGLKYRAHVQNVGWCPEVHDGQTAGTTGLALRLEALKINPPEGLELEVIAHIQNKGDTTFKGIKKGNDVVIGTTGKALRLEGLTIKCTKNTTGKKLQYRTHVQNEGWQPWKSESEFAGTRGKALRCEAVQIKLV